MSTTDSPAKQAFLTNLEQHTKAVADIGLLKLYFEEHLVRILQNLPGQSGSLRVFANVVKQGWIDHAAAQQALKIFEPFVAEARTQPGKHPNIDFLLALLPNQKIKVESVTTTPDLFAKLADGTASMEEKRSAVELLELGHVRCAEKIFDCSVSEGGLQLTGRYLWIPQMYAVNCMNAAFSAWPMNMMDPYFYDKVPLLTEGWDAARYEKAGVRFIPGSFARKGAFIGSGTTIMPGGIVNTGAYVAGDGILIDGGARVATGVQIGKGVKLGAGSGIEGILEPKGRLPVIIEDQVRIGANCEICGIIEQGAIVASGVVMAAGKKIFDLRTGEEQKPRYMEVAEKFYEIPVIPANRVAIGGSYRKTADLSIDCIILLEKESDQTSLAQLPKNAELYLKP